MSIAGEESQQRGKVETNVRTPMDIFNLPQRLAVPLFQRPYVWDEAEQWQPLWQDVRRMAELRLADPLSNASHFLGAVVLQAHDHQTGTLPARNVIDGQQRLTTLQLLMDAAGAVLEEEGLDALAGQLSMLTHNLELYVTGSETRLKLRHSNRDRAAFDEVMNAEPPVDHDGLKHSGALIVRAHRFFASAVDEWLGLDERFRAERAGVLVQVLTRGLQLVVIDLQASENSQEIFETLNARGTPLTAADLVKNFIFQRLEAEGVDTKRAYAEDWPFDSGFWETDVAVGRYNVSRSSLFLNQWLGSRVGEEISPKSTFNRFKHYVEHESGQKMSTLLVTLKRQADEYQRWTEAAGDPDRALPPTEMAVYRMKAAGVEVLKPLLIWLHDPECAIPADVVDDVIAATESWVVRRQLLRLQSADLGRIVAELIATHRTTPAHELAESVRAFLTRLATASSYWPGDDEVRSALLVENAYRRFPRGRLRMYLEAVEDRLRHAYKYPPVPRRGYPIEHVLPQKWEAHWGVEGLEAQVARAAHVHRLGNLTLLTEGLNSAVSNGPWSAKRAKLAKYDVFLINRRFPDADSGEWDEAAIDGRTAWMVDAILDTWPVPEGHAGELSHAAPEDNAWVEIKHLVAAGLLVPGSRLVPRPGKWGAVHAVVRADGLLEMNGTTFETPSGAGRHLKGGATNGWSFWRLEDGRKLAEVRAVFRGAKPGRRNDERFDWGPLHVILEGLPEGRWTTYGDLADVIGTAPQPLGSHITQCRQCVNAHRVLTGDGRVAEGFHWSDPNDERDPVEVLADEGVALDQGRAAPDRRLTSEDLATLAAAV